MLPYGGEIKHLLSPASSPWQRPIAGAQGREQEQTELPVTLAQNIVLISRGGCLWIL